MAQDPSWRHGARPADEARQLPAEAVIQADLRVPQVETSSVISAVLCFAVGFGACLLVVHYMLPALVHAQCVEIVREYVDHTRRESDIRVVVLDRERHEPLRKPRRVSVPAGDENADTLDAAQHYLRVDKPTSVADSAPLGASDSHRDESSDSMLSQIYQHNLRLRDQLRKQSQSVKQ
ncbi:MAG: hypothetical protein O3C40_09865 [Planctomycetota bacterium]|nr:hypothetical protein [Planctomycetota bacterium]